MTNPVSQWITLAGGNNITLSQAGNAVSIMGDLAEGEAPLDRPMVVKMDTQGFNQNLEEYYFNTIPNAAQSTFGQTTSMMQPFQLPYPLAWSYMRFPVSWATNNASTTMATARGAGTTASHATTWNVQIFVDGDGANSQSLQQVMSTSVSMAIQWSSSGSGGGAAGSSWGMSYRMSYPMSSTNQATASTSSSSLLTSVTVGTGLFSVFTGNRMLDVPFTSTLPSGKYWMAFGSSTASATGAATMSALSNVRLQPFSLFPHTHTNAVSLAEMASASNQTIQFPRGYGSFTAAAGATTASVPFANISVFSNMPNFGFGIARKA